MRFRAALLAAGILALIFLVWRLIVSDTDETAARIEGAAGRDLVTACNQAAAAAGATARFTAADVARSQRAPGDGQGGVVALASILEARHDGVLCRWNGIDPPTLARED